MTRSIRHWFLDRPLASKLVLVFSLSFLFLVLVTFSTLEAFRDFEKAEELAQRSEKIRSQAIYYMDLLNAIQNGFRGYLLTRDRSFLAPYDESKGDIDLAGHELVRLVQHSPSQAQRDRVANVQAITRRLIQEKDWVIARVESGLHREGTAYIKSGRGRELASAISSLLVALETEATEIQKARQDIVESKRAMLLNTIVGGTLLTLLLTGLGVIIVARSVTNPMTALARAAEEIGESGRASFPDANRLDEVGALSRSMVYMDHQIRTHIAQLVQSEAEMRRLNLSLTASEHRYRFLVEHVPLGIFTTRGLTWTFANRFERELMGLPDGVELSFARWKEALHPDDRERVVREFEDAVAGLVPFESSFRYVRADGSVKHVLSGGVPVEDPATGEVFYLCIGLDVTQIEELQQRLAPAERLAALTRVATSIAHDLRTPLVGLEQGLQGLQYAAEPHLSPDAQRLLGDLHTGARLAVGIVQDILDLYRQAYGALPLSYSRFIMGDVIREVVDLMKSEILDRRLSVSIEAPPLEISADQRRLYRVMVNLLDNAVKNSPAGGLVRIVVSAQGDGTGRRAIVAVEDEGRGLDPETLDTLFEPNRPASTPTRGGTGLGLYLCRLVIGAHGGTLTAQNRPEGGARFVFDIPAEVTHVDDSAPDRGRPTSVPAESAHRP